MDLPARWHPKPPAGTRCDLGVGTGTDSCGRPTIIVCERAASETCWTPKSIMPWIYLCTEHVAQLAHDERVYRNPRRR